MTRMLALSLLLLLVGHPNDCRAGNGSASSLDEIEFWIGNGPNSAALAIDWDGESTSDEALAWGYRWDDTATGTDLLVDILTADSRLYAKLAQVTNLGTAVVGLGYDENNDEQFALTDQTGFDERGINLSELSDAETSIDETDRYEEGWFLGYWHVGTATTNPFDDGEWESSFFGLDDIDLTDQMWLSLAFTTDTLSTSEFAENLRAADSLVPPNINADFDSDGDIDGTDLLAWQQGFGILTDATLEEGDANADGRVDQLDLQVWSAAYGSPAIAQSIFVVPEPHSIWTFVYVVVSSLGTRSYFLCRTPRSCT